MRLSLDAVVTTGSLYPHPVRCVLNLLPKYIPPGVWEGAGHSLGYGRVACALNSYDFFTQLCDRPLQSISECVVNPCVAQLLNFPIL